MKKASNITPYILVKAATNSEWDNCHFALIHYTSEWKEQMKQHLKVVQSIEDEIGFASLSFYDTSVDFYQTDDDTPTEINQLLENKDWTFVELDDNEQETLQVPENRLEIYRVSFYRSGTAIYTAYGKYSGEEFYTAEFSIKDILNYHQETIQIIRFY